MLRVLFDHWELKLVAVAVAFTLWFFVATSDQALLGLATPVEYVGLPPGLVLVTGQRESVDVQVRAVRSVAARLSPETMRVQVDLTGLREGEPSVQIKPSDVQVPHRRDGDALSRARCSYGAPGRTVTATVSRRSRRSLRRARHPPRSRGPLICEYQGSAVYNRVARGDFDVVPVDIAGSADGRPERRADAPAART